jgi:hypothetical protein
LLALAESIGINEPASDLIDASDIPILLPGIALVVESGGGDEFDAGGMEQSATSPDPGIALVAPGGAEPCAEIAAPPAIACEALIESDEDQVVSIDLSGKETPDELAPAEPVSDLPKRFRVHPSSRKPQQNPNHTRKQRTRVRSQSRSHRRLRPLQHRNPV